MKGKYIVRTVNYFNAVNYHVFENLEDAELALNIFKSIAEGTKYEVSIEHDGKIIK